MSKNIAITSPVIEKNLGYEIKKINLSHYLVYRIIIETGIPFTQLCSLKVASFRGKTSLSYLLHNKSVYTEPLSRDTMENIALYVAEKTDDELMFSNRNVNTPLDEYPFRRTLQRAANKIGFPHTMTLPILKRTYFYRLLERTDDIAAFKVRINLRYDKEIFNYLGIDTYPQKITTWNKNVFDQFYESCNQKELSKDFRFFLSTMETLYAEKSLPEIFYKENIETFRLISNILKDYKKFIEESNLL